MAGHHGSVLTLIGAKDGLILSGSADGTIRVWDSATGACLRTLVGHGGYVSSLAMLSDGRLISSSGDKTVRVWE
jgi:WD40 repeat protein